MFGKWWKQDYFIYSILTLLVFIVYINAFDNSFVSDDIAEIKNNPAITSFNFVTSHITGFIRPLWYYLAYKIGGATPFLYRILNILLHLGTVIVLYKITQLLYKQRVAMVTAVLFAIHPILTEPITWISGGAYVQYSFFYMLAFILYIKSRNNKHLYLLSLMVYLLSLISQQVAVTFPAIILLYEVVFGNFKKGLIIALPFIIFSGIWLGISVLAIPQRIQTLQTVHYQKTQVQNPLRLIPVATTEYLELIFWPQDLTLYHSELNYSKLEFIIRVVISIALLILLIISLFRFKIVFFWLSFFIINLSPTITTATFGLTWIVAERYVYLSSIGIFIIVSYYFIKISSYKKLSSYIYILLAILIITLSVRTVMRNDDWDNEDNLWVATGRTSPSSPNTHNNLGDMYGRHKNYPMAVKEFETAILLKPDYADAYHNLGNTYNEIGDKGKAIELYKKAAELNPILWQSRQNIAALYFEQQKYPEAIEQLQMAIRISPNNLNLYMNLGIIYLKQGDKEKAKQLFSQILQSIPNYQPALQGLAEASK